MKNTIQNFKRKNFYESSVELFKKLSIPLDSITELSIEPNDIFETPKSFFDKVKNIYTLGMVSDNVFDGEKSEFNPKNKKDYEAVLIFAVELNESKPSRTLLSDIARAFNREYHYTPVIVLFKYDDNLSLANTQRQNYKINKEGEKAGKVTILRDINITNPHTGHIKILNDMKISPKIKTYDELYKYWQEVFDVSILNKAFYKELQNWYFYAINEVVFPNEPRPTDPKFDTDKLKEYRAKNVIRLLTRLLFVWFIKEKGLVPNELFEEYDIKKLIKNFEPKKQDKNTLFGGHDKESRYYKAILQNLFFATLNQEMGQRKFRKDGANQNTTNLMRYKKHFTNSNDFISLVESVVPFMNGGLFECLDAPHPTKKSPQGGDIIVYEDGFSDRADNPLIVPDYIFFGHEDHVDLSVEYGSKNKAFKDASVKGLINILKSYKFTIAENTPIEEDVALDPELLGKVFENLLASYNPETKTTARKQTGSFYTPREIVSYMVVESLISYLKTKLDDEDIDKDELDKKLHGLLAYDDKNPFSDDKEISKKIIDAIDEVKILDPAVGSGAFPMGALQKMVHILSKLDPENTYWQDLQLKKAQDETNDAFKSNDRNSIKEKIDEIFDSFDETINNPDYARKLYLIENTIFGVDIQPIAIQISKLRFFISLVVEQNINNDKENFGIRPLPNLESKFVAANTLIGLELAQQNLFDRSDIKELENELQDIRHKIFNAKTPKTKRKYRDLDKELRDKIKQVLIDNGVGNNTAEQLSSWDPYDQNSSSAFFDMEWMFGIEDGFNIVIGNPPYIDSETMTKNTPNFREQLKKKFLTAKGNWDLFVVFIEQSIKLAQNNGNSCLIVPNKLISAKYTHHLRKFMMKYNLLEIRDYSSVDVFSEADVYPVVYRLFKNEDSRESTSTKVMDSLEEYITENEIHYNQFNVDIFWDKYFFNTEFLNIVLKISQFRSIESFNFEILGAATVNEAYEIKEVLKEQDQSNNYFKFINTGTIDPYQNLWSKKNTQYIKGAYEKPVIEHKDLQNINLTRFEQANSNKIIIAGMAIRIEAFFDKGEYLAGKSTTIILGEEKYLKILTAILNSKLATFWFSRYYNSLTMAGGYFNMGRNEIGSIPIPNLENIDIDVTILIVEKIINYKEYDKDTTELENQIDQIVYKLYGLTEDEIKIIEDSIK